MKVGIVYTSTTPELIDLVEKELRQNVGEKAEFIASGSSILAESGQPICYPEIADQSSVHRHMWGEVLLNCCFRWRSFECVQDGRLPNPIVR
jgi:hypothetical protein